jgi:LCP family protein required for cell wall assembly
MKLFGNNRGKHAPSPAKEPENTENTENIEKSGKKKSKAPRRIVTVLGIIVLLAVCVVVGYSIWEKPPELAETKKPVNTADISAPVSSAAPGETADPDDLIEEISGEPLDTDRDDGVYTFLLVGRDHESNSTDTIIVGKVDTVNHTIDCVNIPRDTLINISWGSTPKKINAVYPGYTNSGRSGIEGLKTHIKNLIGFDVDCYAVVNLKVVEDVINEIGGVYFDVPIDMDYDDGGQHFHVHLKSGYQKLNGYEALGVFRYRYGNNGNTYPGGDLERIGVQQDLMKSIASQMLTLGNIPNLSNVIQLCMDNVETDLTASNLAFFARQFLQCKVEDINFHTAPYTNTCSINGISYVSLDVEPWIQMVNDYLNPYTQKVSLANVNILTSNASGSNVIATTGTIAGGIDTFFCNVGKSTCELSGTSYHSPGAHVAPGETEPEVEASPEPTADPSPESTPEPSPDTPTQPDADPSGNSPDSEVDSLG